MLGVRDRSSRGLGSRERRGWQRRGERIRYRFVWRRGRWRRPTQWVVTGSTVKFMAYIVEHCRIRGFMWMALHLFGVIVYVQHLSAASHGDGRAGGEGELKERLGKSALQAAVEHEYCPTSARASRPRLRRFGYSEPTCTVRPNASIAHPTLPRVSSRLSSPMDVAALRAELKTWERDFRSTHSRNPTVDEIKEQPAIGTWPALSSFRA